MTTAAKPLFTLKAWHAGIGIVGFFVLVTGTDIGLATLAYKSYPGEVSARPYEDGLAYNAAIAQRERQAALGWRATAETYGVGAGRVIEVRITQADQPIRDLRVEGALARTVTATGDAHLRFAEAGPGVYRAAAPVAPGQWAFSFVATDRAGHRFEGERRFVWR